MAVIFHIGHHKTGTTSLQAFLAKNQVKLLKAGILSPWVEGNGAAYALSRAIHPRRHQNLSINSREPHNALAFQMLADALPNWKVPDYHGDLPGSQQLLAAIQAQVETFAPRHVVFCSEVMSHFGIVAPELITRISAPFAGEAFRLHCTLRRFDDHLVSWHGQRLRFGGKEAPLSASPDNATQDSLHFDFDRVIEPWIRLLPASTFIIRPYRETLAAGGSIGDFKSHSGIGFPWGLENVTSLNTSLPAAAFSLFREANATLAQPVARSLRQELPKLLDGLDLPHASQIEFFGETGRARLFEKARPIHDYLSDLTGRASFFDDFEEMAMCKPIPEAEATARLLDQLTPERISQLSNPDARAFVTRFKAEYKPLSVT
jgi:hypothetical protein